MSKCGYNGCEYDDSSHRPYARKRDGIPSASLIAGLLDTGKSRSFSWAASLIASTVAVHHPDQWHGLVGQMSDRAWNNGHTICGHEKDSLCKACTYIRSAFDREWNQKAVLGTHVHHLALQWAEGETIETDSTTDRYMDCLWDWYQQYSPVFVELERTILYDKPRSHAYRGQFDFIAEINCPVHKERCKWLVDIKTGGYWPTEQTLQLAGYRFAQHITEWDGKEETIVKPMVPVAHAGVLLLDPEIGGRLVELPATGDVHGTFLRLVDAYRWSQEMDKWSKENPLNGETEEPAA